MATADEARRLRVEKGAVNHETYRGIFDKIVQRIELRAKRGGTEIEYRVPPIVPGRPIFDLGHAVRYCRDKLTHRGFRVTIADDVILVVDWKPTTVQQQPHQQPAKKALPPTTPTQTTSAPPKKSQPTSTKDITKRLELLARKLNWT